MKPATQTIRKCVLSYWY